MLVSRSIQSQLLLLFFISSFTILLFYKSTSLARSRGRLSLTTLIATSILNHTCRLLCCLLLRTPIQDQVVHLQLHQNLLNLLSLTLFSIHICLQQLLHHLLVSNAIGGQVNSDGSHSGHLTLRVLLLDVDASVRCRFHLLLLLGLPHLLHLAGHLVLILTHLVHKHRHLLIHH